MISAPLQHGSRYIEKTGSNCLSMGREKSAALGSAQPVLTGWRRCPCVLVSGKGVARRNGQPYLPGPVLRDQLANLYTSYLLPFRLGKAGGGETGDREEGGGVKVEGRENRWGWVEVGGGVHRKCSERVRRCGRLLPTNPLCDPERKKQTKST